MGAHPLAQSLSARLTTRAKGLEFDTVCLPGSEAGVVPNHRARDENANKGLEEARRLAYGGLTRARKLALIEQPNPTWRDLYAEIL